MSRFAWLRGRPRWKRVLAVALVLAVVVRLALPFALPAVLARVAAARGLALSVDGVELSVLGGRLELWRIDVRLRDAAEPADEASGEAPGEASGELLAHIEHLAFDLDVSALFTGTVRVDRAEVDGLDLFLARDAAGRWNFAPVLGNGAPEPEPAAAEPSDEPSTGPLSFDLPAEVRFARVQNVRVHVDDRAVEPPVAGRLDFSLRLSHLGSRGGASARPTRLEVLAHAPGVLDALRVEGGGSSAGLTADARLELHMEGFDPRPLAGWLAGLGLRADARELGLALALEAHAEPRPAAAEEKEPTEARARLALERFALTADGEDALGLGGLDIDVPRIARTERGPEIEVGVARAHEATGTAERLADGTLRFAGLAWVGGGRSGESADEVAGDAEPDDGGAVPAPDPMLAGARPAFRATLERILLENGRLTLLDAAVEPPAVLEFDVHEGALDGIAFGTDTPQPIRVSAHASAPGIVGSAVVEGTVEPFALPRAFDLKVSIAGLAPERAAPYLRAAGLESTLMEGHATARLAGSQRAAGGATQLELRLTEAEFGDGERELAALDSLEAQIALGPEPGAVRGSARLAGLRTGLARDAARRFEVLGLRTLGLEAAGATGPAVDVPPMRIELARVDAALEDFALGVPASAASGPARVRCELVLTDLAEQLLLEGTLATEHEPLVAHARFALSGRGLRYDALAPLLSDLGLEAELAAGTFDAQLAADVERDGDGWLAALRVSEVAFADAGATHLALAEFSVPQVRIAPDGVSIESVALVGAELAAHRDAEGAFSGLGLRFVPGTAAASATVAPTSAAPSAAAHSADPDPDPAPPLTKRIALGALRVEGARIAWSDAFVTPAFDTELTAALELSGLVLGGDAPPAQPAVFGAHLALAGALDEAALEGTVAVTPQDARLALTVRALGIRAEPLAGYMPPGIEGALADGRLAFGLNASFGMAEAGGRRAAIELTDLGLLDGGAGDERSLLRIQRVALGVERHDPGAQILRIGEVSVAGVELDVRRTGASRIELLGLAFEAPAAETADAAEADEAEQAAEAIEAAAARAPAPPVSPASRATPRARTTPRIELGRFGLEFARLTFLDETDPSAVPLDLSLSLSAPQDVVLLDPAAEEHAPLELTLTGSAAPVVGALSASATLEPFAPEPHAFFEFEASGLRGDGLTEVLPSLAQQLEGGGLRDGLLRGSADVLLRARRRGPLDFDLASGFGLELVAGPIEFREGRDSPLLAGVESLAVDARQILPSTGDVRIATIEIGKPTALVTKEEGGLRLLGLLVRTPAAPGAGETLGETPGEPVVEAAPSAPTPAPGPEFAIDRLELTGLDVEYRDLTVEPPMVLPLVDAEIELRRFTTRALVESLPVQFRAALYAGTVELPERSTAGSLLSGVLGAAAAAVGGGSDDAEREPRSLFEQLELSGNLVLHPLPKGWVRMQVGALELPAFRGAAQGAGVDIGDGLLDLDARLRFRGDDGLSVDSKTSFSYLSLSEPPGGPISSWLKLPAPLDTVLFVLRNEAGEQVIPLNMRVPAGGLSPLAVSRTVATTLGQVIADAISASPFRIIGGVLDLTGLDFGEPVELSDETLAVAFESGQSTFESAAWDSLLPLLDAMRRDSSIELVVQHELGRGDLARAERLANPTVEECLELAARLRGRKGEVLAARSGIAAEVRASTAVGRAAEASAAAARLRALEVELEQLESGLDDVLELTRPGAERGRDKRTRLAALTLADLRLAAVRRALLSAGVPRIAQRIDVRRPRFAPPGEEAEPGGRVTITPRRSP